MFRTNVGQLLINDSLPEGLRQPRHTLDKKGVTALLGQLAERHPEQYRDVLKKLMDIGRESSYLTGGNSFGAAHLRPGTATIVARNRIRAAQQQIFSDDSIPDAEKGERLMQVVAAERQKMIPALYEESLAEGNPLAQQVISGARGSTTNLSSLRGFDGAYEDHHGNVVPIPVLKNYSEGLSPAEFWASTSGARKGVTDVKMGVAKAGYVNKQLTQLSHRLLVSQLDDDEDPDNSKRLGMPSPIDDRDNEGSLLATDHGQFKRNTVLTPKIIQALKRGGFDELLLRSPIAGGPRDGGVYARDVGMRERGGLSPLGDYVGIAAAQSVSEKLTQAGLSSKHSGGVAGAGPTGFDLINQLLQTPENFQGGATHAQRDGHINDIRDAPQGGQLLFIDGVEHYVPPERKLTVQPGATVEAGDILTDGLPNPAEIVQHKGVGEGRRYFVQQFRKAAEESGVRSHRRNLELIARGLIDHVEVTDPWEDYAPGDVIPYREVSSRWQPREGSAIVPPGRAVGKYLERPTLHYTIGTQIKPSMIPQFQKFQVGGLEVHDDPPPFQPQMQRAAASISTDPDWMTRMLGSGQKGNLLDSVHRGGVSDTLGTSYVPALVEGANFGKVGPTQGW